MVDHLVPIEPNADDYEFAWRHAFAYADCRTIFEGAEAYANHYAAIIRGIEDLNDWPDHTEVFGAWRKSAGSEYPFGQ